MARTKSSGRSRQKAVVATFDIESDRQIPSSLIESLLSLPSLDTSDPHPSDHNASPCDDRSAKRIKLDPSVPDEGGISIAKDEIVISRMYGGWHRPSTIEKRRDIGSFVRFTIQRDQLLVFSRPTCPVGPLSCRFSLKPGEMTKKARHIIDVGGMESRQPTAGAIWTSVDLAVKPEDKGISLILKLELFWNDTPSPYLALRPNKSRKISQKLIDTFYPSDASQSVHSTWSPMDFYDAAYVPPCNDGVSSTIKVQGLTASLFPYQKRTLQWLLAREGMCWDEESSALAALPYGGLPTSNSFREIRDSDGSKAYLSDVFQTMTRNMVAYQQAAAAVKGGILAEEMGLGKTLEIIGLVLLHRRPKLVASQLSSEGLRPSGATLIVTPEALRPQWISEILRHAPGLRVRHYKGCRKDVDAEDDIVGELADYDVVLTTYNVLSAELHFAREPPQRSRRYSPVYPRVMSPLVQISWWRLCLDEAQMIENGFSQAAAVARSIPRINAWGITGTPVKDHVKDLFGLLLFLRFEPYCSAPQVWQALLGHHKPVFQDIFRTISLRHTKILVRDELSLPPQKRFVISMPFTAVEEQHYQTMYRQMAEECKLDSTGVPTVEDWKLDDHEENMRVWLNRLRQTTLHPEIGLYNRRALGYSKSRPMRTVDEVLTAMIEQSENSILSDERTYLLIRLTRGQLYENSLKVKEALAIWDDVRMDAKRLVRDARDRLSSATEEEGVAEPHGNFGNESSHESTDSENISGESQKKGRIGDCRRRLRVALEIYHRAVFFCANAYFQIRENTEMTVPDSEEFVHLKKLEDDGYEESQVIRREILREAYRKASGLMKRIARKGAEQSFTEVPELVIDPEKGIESGHIVDKLEILYEELNKQANILDEWREHLIELLLKPLVDEDDGVEITGDELNDSTKIQEEVMVYVQAVRAAIADRQDAITGQTNVLVKHETETSLKIAKDGDGPAPAKLIELLQVRAQMKPRLAHTSMRAAISEFRGLQSKLNRDLTTQTSREVLESRIASAQFKSTQMALNEQTKAALALESEIDIFTIAMNSRLQYYRQLQAVSDAVLTYSGPKTEEAAAKLKQTEDDLKRKLSSSESKHRYLLNLKDAGAKSDEPRMCVICQMSFMTGVLTVCGHEFCKECMTVWFKAHHNCPVCKRRLKASNLYDITLKRKQLQIHSEGEQRRGEDRNMTSTIRPNTASTKTHIYSEFNSERLSEITNMDLDGPSFTTKVDTLVRHLLWLRGSDPGAKSIVFSQYKGFLDVLRNAFSRFRIGYSSIDDASGITNFKEDAAIECFLLHARAHSSGLNLVNASHVFLCEPLLNTALELQAIARVDRIGQEHETTVWLYLVSGTIEESIHNLSVERRMEHMGRNTKGKATESLSTPDVLKANIEAANTLELENAALSKLMSRDKTAGEMVDKNDLWQCLFGHVQHQPAEEALQDSRFGDKEVMSHLASEAAESRSMVIHAAKNKE